MISSWEELDAGSGAGLGMGVEGIWPHCAYLLALSKSSVFVLENIDFGIQVLHAPFSSADKSRFLDNCSSRTLFAELTSGSR